MAYLLRKLLKTTHASASMVLRPRVGYRHRNFCLQLVLCLGQYCEKTAGNNGQKRVKWDRHAQEDKHTITEYIVVQ